MKVLIDMNLSPEWVSVFRLHQIDAVHWSQVGHFAAPDREIMEWARQNSYIVFTHDLDFGTALALTGAEKPSVIQVRTQNVSVNHLKEIVISSIATHHDVLNSGALIIIDEDKRRIRILPLR